MTLLYVLLFAILSTYTLWTLFLAVMALKRTRDAGLLVKRALVLGTPILILGLLVDALVNWIVMTIVLLEVPKEHTVTSRLKRHNKESVGWRKSVAVWCEPLLDPFDPSGDHI